MGAEIGVHSVAAGNAAFTGLDSNPPKSIGIYLVSDDAAFASGTVRADAGVYIHGASGFEWPIWGRDTDGSPLFGVNQRGNYFGGAGGNNAAEVAYGFYEDATGGAKGLFSAGTDVIALGTAGAERMRLDSLGNVGVGNATAPSGSRLYVTGGLIEANGGLKNNGPEVITGVVTPPELTADANNYSPTGLATARVLRLTSNASRQITGIAAPSGSAKVVLTLRNAGGNPIVLPNEAAGSTAANRFATPASADITLGVNQSVTVWYDDSQRWVVMDR